MQQVKLSLPPGRRMGRALADDIMRHHSAVYGCLPLHVQSNYDELAAAMDVASQARAQDDIDMLEASLQLRASRREQELRGSAPLCAIAGIIPLTISWGVLLPCIILDITVAVKWMWR